MIERRKNRIEIRMSDDEIKLLETRYNLSTSKSISDFVRGQILDGVVVSITVVKSGI